MGDKPKKKFYKKWWFWVLVVVIIGFAISQSGNNEPKKVSQSNQSTTESEQSKQAQTASTESTPKTKTFKIGETVQLKDYKVTVNKIRTSQGDDVSQPKQGNEFLYVDCTVENISNEQKTVSSVMMFKVEDKDGRSYEQTITTDGNGQLDGDVAPGRKITGEYIVEVPQGKTGLDLVFDSSLISSGQVIVNLN
jgi:hypothetical protein